MWLGLDVLTKPLPFSRESLRRSLLIERLRAELTYNRALHLFGKGDPRGLAELQAGIDSRR